MDHSRFGDTEATSLLAEKPKLHSMAAGTEEKVEYIDTTLETSFQQGRHPNAPEITSTAMGVDADKKAPASLEKPRYFTNTDGGYLM